MFFDLIRSLFSRFSGGAQAPAEIHQEVPTDDEELPWVRAARVLTALLEDIERHDRAAARKEAA